MESKKLPVLWLDRELIHDANWPLYDYAICCTTRPHQSCREPYIPVARVREMIASIKVAAKDMSHPSMNRDCWLCGMVHLQKLIEDVDMEMLRDEG